MTTLHTLILVGHVVISIMIIVLVLLQRGKGADAGAAFGAGASGTVFGAKGSANFLSRSTAALATLFFVSSLALAFLGSERPVSRSILDDTAPALDAPALNPVTEPGAATDLPVLPEPVAAPESPAEPQPQP